MNKANQIKSTKLIPDKKYPSISGIRAISIVLVIISHLGGFEKYFEINKWLRPFVYFLEDGQLGVNIFFVISGFLITTLLLLEEKKTKKISLKNFYIRRTLRIFPAFYFLLLVYLILQFIGVLHISNASWLSAVTYTKYFNWELDWPTAHAWSLSVEEHFYLLWPLIFLCGNRFRKFFAIALILAVPLVRMYTNAYPVSWINFLTIFTRIDAIATGCIFALFRDEIIELFKSRWKLVFYFSVLGLLSLRFLPALFDKIGAAYIFIPLGITYGTIANFLIGIIIMYSIFGPQKNWFKFLNLRIVNYIGILSYSLYLWQQLFLLGKGYWAMQFPQNLFFVFATAMFSYHFIEKPFLKLKERFSSQKNKNVAPLTTSV